MKGMAVHGGLRQHMVCTPASAQQVAAIFTEQAWRFSVRTMQSLCVCLCSLERVWLTAHLYTVLGGSVELLAHINCMIMGHIMYATMDSPDNSLRLWR